MLVNALLFAIIIFEPKIYTKSKMKTGKPSILNSGLPTTLIIFNPLAEWLMIFKIFSPLADQSASGSVR
jgi:hypothetical protein